MMKVLVMGANGMLGHKLAERFSRRFETVASVRADASAFARVPCFRNVRIIGGVTAETSALEDLVRKERPDVVINAIGVVKQDPLGNDSHECDLVNARLPHRIASACEEAGARFIGISTDCVFSGARGNYTEEDPPDADDVYGRSKLRGEVISGDSLTVRTSIFGRELEGSRGLVEWFLARRGGVLPGFRRAVFSGFPTYELADILAKVILEFPKLRGLYHVSSSPISKFELLALLNAGFSTGTGIEEDHAVVINRSLDSSRFREATGYTPPSWEEMVRGLVHDSSSYNIWRKK